MFSNGVWAAQVSVITINVYVWYIFLRYDRQYWKIQNYLDIAFRIFVGTPIDYRPKNVLICIVLGINMLSCVLFMIVFNSMWIEGYNRLQNDQVVTVEEALDKDFRFAGEGDFMKSIDYQGIYRRINDVYRSCGNINHCLNELETNNKLVLLLSRAHAHNNPYINESALYCFPPAQHIYSFTIVMLTREKHFLLLPKINQLLQKFAESGLLKKWMNENELRRKITETLDSANSNRHTKQVVTFSHIKPTIFHLIITDTGAALCLLLETLGAHYVKKGKRHGRRVSIVWKMLDFYFNEKRYMFNDAPSIF